MGRRGVLDLTVRVRRVELELVHQLDLTSPGRASNKETDQTLEDEASTKVLQVSSTDHKKTTSSSDLQHAVQGSSIGASLTCRLVLASIEVARIPYFTRPPRLPAADKERVSRHRIHLSSRK